MLYIIVLFVYFIVLLGISLYANKINENKSDYILGGRRLGLVTTGISAGAADMSGWLFLGLPGAVYALGINQAWIAIGLTLGAWVNWLLVSYNLRVFSFKTNSLTVPSFMAAHLEGDGKFIQIVASIAIMIFFTIYVTSGITAGGVLLSTLFDISYSTGIMIALIFVVIYVLIGGYLAVAWTDLVQGILMLFIIIAVPVAALNAMNWDFPQIASRALAYNPHAFNIGYHMSFLEIISLLAWGLGYVGQPHVLTRFMGIKDANKLKKSCYINIVWMAVGMTFAVIIGLIASAYFYKTPLADPEKAIIALGKATSLPIIVAFISVAILAAIVSTANAQLLVISSSITEDLSLFTKLNKKYDMLLSRVIILVVAIIAFMLSMNKNSTILSIVAYAWAGFGASFGPLIILITRGKKLSTFAGAGGIIFGAITVITWKNLHGGLFDVYEILPGFIISFIAILVLEKIYRMRNPNN
ncbi:High-affinity proline transporter PutP [Candidatus Hepatincola sp. Pdp]